MNADASAWDAAIPVNTGRCATHGAYTGLICTGCTTTLPPRWVDVPPAREPAPRVYARVLGADPADGDPGGPR